MSMTTIFDAFRVELDDHNDRRERLIKASRDITNISKKTIFLLHRVALESPREGEPKRSTLRAAEQGRPALQQVQKIYANLKDDVEGDRFWRYERQVAPGLQEYIEALSLAHFMEHGSLITFDEVQRTLCDPHGIPFFPLTVSDYLLGLSDLTGELMRYAISGLSKRGGRIQAMSTLAFVRMCKADFDMFTSQVRGLTKKQAVTAQSMQKIEDAVYAIVVRTSEYDLPPELLGDVVAKASSNGNSESSSGGRKRKGRDSDDEEEY